MAPPSLGMSLPQKIPRLKPPIQDADRMCDIAHHSILTIHRSLGLIPISTMLHPTMMFKPNSRARAINETLRAVVGKAMDPRAQGGIGKGEGVRDGLQALPFHDVAYGLGRAKDASFFGLL